MTVSKFYHYTDCGLDNIWLDGGVEVHDTPYGKATSIRSMDTLHNAIGLDIVRSGSVSAKEMRFLRYELDLSQKSFAGIIGATEQQVHRWENGKMAIPKPVQALLCAYYIETLDPNSRCKELLDRLAALDNRCAELERKIFMLCDKAWIASAA